MIVVAGAGCAGLSLAVRLAARPELGRVVVLDPRARFDGDRTFCFFRGRPHPFDAAVTHEWWQVRVAHEGREVVRETRRPYQHLPGHAFHDAALAALEDAPHVELHLGTSVERIEEHASRVDVETSAGRVRARVVFDARGLAVRGDAPGRAASGLSRGDVRWVQHFGGWHVRVERPVFETGVATLMDFRVPQEPGPRFVYVLPFTETEALVEDTYFSEEALPAEAYERGVARYVESLGAGAYEILRRERGVIPMTTLPSPRATDRVVPIGLAGGVAKPSTGYHFSFAQRHAERLVEALARGEPLARAAPPRSHVASFFDRVFLSYLAENRERAPQVFTDLFARVPGTALARFLSEEGGVLDHLRVMRSVPRRAVMAEIARSAPLWLRPP